MSSLQRDLEILLLGAILADPELKTQIDGFSEKDLAEILRQIKEGKVSALRKFLGDREVLFQNGKGEAFKGVKKQQRLNWIRNEIADANIRLHAATRLHCQSGITREIDRLQELKAMLAQQDEQPTRRLLKPPSQ